MILVMDSNREPNGANGQLSQESPSSLSSSTVASNSNLILTPDWLFDKSALLHTPSIHDGLTFDQELQCRSEGARFIIKVGGQMKLNYSTFATGVVYFHRFYMVHSFKTFSRHVTASCCLFLAGKAEETPKKCKDIIKFAKAELTEEQFAKFGDDPREELLTMERIVLQTIRFDLQVEHPYTYLINYAKGFKGKEEVISQLVQMAWTFANDRLVFASIVLVF